MVALAPNPMQQSSSTTQNLLVQNANVRSPTHLTLNDPLLQSKFGVTASELALEMNSPFQDNSRTVYRTVSEADISDVPLSTRPLLSRVHHASQSTLNHTTIPSVEATAVAAIALGNSFNSQQSLGLRDLRA